MPLFDMRCLRNVPETYSGATGDDYDKPWGEKSMSVTLSTREIW